MLDDIARRYGTRPSSLLHGDMLDLQIDYLCYAAADEETLRLIRSNPDAVRLVLTR